MAGPASISAWVRATGDAPEPPVGVPEPPGARRAKPGRMGPYDCPAHGRGTLSTVDAALLWTHCAALGGWTLAGCKRMPMPAAHVVQQDERRCQRRAREPKLHPGLRACSTNTRPAPCAPSRRVRACTLARAEPRDDTPRHPQIAPVDPKKAKYLDGLSRSRPPKPWWGTAPRRISSGRVSPSRSRAAMWRDRRRWESPDGRYWFDRAAADAAVDFFPTFLRHHIGAFRGQPFKLLPYQIKLLTRPLFGWKRTADSLRRFRRVTLFAPKASGKSPWGSAAPRLYLLLFDQEPCAGMLRARLDREQARVVHRDAKSCSRARPSSRRAARCLRDSIFVPQPNSTFKVLSADATSAHGWRPHGVILDEIQLQKNRDLLEVARR